VSLAPAPDKKPVPEPDNNKSKSDKTFIVKQGDTLRSIAESHKISYKKLPKINDFLKHKRVSIDEEIGIR
jgi:LysM repeat protein